MNNKRYQLPDRSIIPLTLADLDTLMEMEEVIYPLPLRENRNTMKKLLAGGNLNFGIIVQNKLAGFLVTTDEYSDGGNYTFIWDISVLPELQRQGLGSSLLGYFLKQARFKKLDVGLACRNTSLPLFSKEDRLRECGYRVAKCELEPDGYYKECGIHEDLYNVELEVMRDEIPL